MEIKTNTSGSETTEPTKTEGAQGGQAEANTPKTYTSEEMQEHLNQIAAKTRKEEKEKAEKAIADAVAEAVAKAEANSKLSAEEREKKVLEEAKKANESKERELTLRGNELDGIRQLDELKLPVKFIKFVLSESKDVMIENINALKKEWTAALDAEVTAQLKGTGAVKDPKQNNGENGKAAIKLSF